MFLLDTSVLIALNDPEHSQHDACHEWFVNNSQHGWTTCPIVENGMVRITSQTSYKTGPATLFDARDAICEMRTLPTYFAIGDDISVCESEFLRFDLVSKPDQITDAYLLGLCRKHGLKLATIDRKIATQLAPGEDIVVSI